MKKLTLENLGSLITYHDGRVTRCLGYLMDFKGRGVFDADHGRVEVTPEQCAVHNLELDKALIKGLDETCEVGQYGTFYFNRNTRRVFTFMGTTIAQGEDVFGVTKTTFRFKRKGRIFLGWIRPSMDLVSVKRIS